MAVINDKYKFMFLCEPHTASRSTRDALMQLETSRETSQYHHINVARAIHNHYLTPEQASEYYLFATIRDPHDLLVTKWFISNGLGRRSRPLSPAGLEKRRVAFFEFIKGHIKTLKDNTIFWRFYRDVNTFVRFEHLEQGINQILISLGAPTISLDYKREYKTDGKTQWQDEWNDKAYHWALDNYQDIVRYSYQRGYDLNDMDALVSPPTN